MRGDVRRFAGPPDMTNQTVGGWTVLRRAANVNGNARWWCQHNCAEPHDQIIEGIKLRSKPPKYCDGCRPKGVGKRGPNRG